MGVPRWLVSGLGVAAALAGIALILRLFWAFHDVDKVHDTMREMRTLAAALELYRMEEHRYPTFTGTADIGLHALMPVDSVKNWPARDPWGTPFQVDSTAREYTITSFGRDHAPGGASGSKRADIVLAGGRFVQFPEEGASVAFVTGAAVQ